MKTIDIIFDTAGNSKVEGVGFPGKTCDEKLKAFEDGLGVIKQRTNKTDYYKSTTTTKETVKQKA